MTTPTPPPVIGYIRVGSPDPNTLSGEFQKRRLTEWAAATGHAIVLWVEEFGVARAGPAFDKAIANCDGKLIVAVASTRVSRHLAEVEARREQVRAAGGRLGFVEGWREVSWQTQVAGLIDEYEAADRKAKTAAYRRRAAGSLDQAGPQQQAAAVWDAAERLGGEVQWVDGAELDRDPREILDED